MSNKLLWGIDDVITSSLKVKFFYECFLGFRGSSKVEFAMPIRGTQKVPYITEPWDAKLKLGFSLKVARTSVQRIQVHRLRFQVQQLL